MARSEKTTTKKLKLGHVFLLCALALVCISTAAYCFLSPYPFGPLRDYINSIDESGVENPSRSENELLSPDASKSSLNSADIFSFLIIGPYDDSGQGRLTADKFALLTLNSRGNKLSLNTLSPDFCALMLNGGSVSTEDDAQALIDGINSALDFQIDGYMLLSSGDTEKILDKAGGVRIKLSPSELEALETGIVPDSSSYARLSGSQALSYLRLESGLEMAEDAENRTQALLLALKASANELGLMDTSGLGLLILNEATTDISKKEFTQLFIRSPGLLNFRVTTGTLPLPAVSAAGEIDAENVRQYLYESIHN